MKIVKQLQSCMCIKTYWVWHTEAQGTKSDSMPINIIVRTAFTTAWKLLKNFTLKNLLIRLININDYVFLLLCYKNLKTLALNGPRQEHKIIGNIVNQSLMYQIILYELSVHTRLQCINQFKWNPGDWCSNLGVRTDCIKLRRNNIRNFDLVLLLLSNE